MTKITHQSLLESIRHTTALTLQEMCRIKIITSLCNNRVLRSSILKCNFVNVHPSCKLYARNGNKWKAIEAMANQHVSQMCIPVLLKKRILELLWPMSYRIMLWKCTYASSIHSSFLQHFHWTDRGRIDNRRTVRSIIGHKSVPVRKRFVSACSVCLEDEIFEIWREMTNEDKAYFLAEDRGGIAPLTLFWARSLEGSVIDREKMDNALICASNNGLLEAVKYLFSIAPEDEKIFMSALCTDGLTIKLKSGDLLEEDENDIGCFVFSQTTDADRETFFNYFTETALSLLLHSSKFKLCLNLLEERLESASVKDVATALEIIFYTYHVGVVKDEDCRRLFMDVWRKIPIRMRKTQIFRNLRVEFLAVLIRDSFSFILVNEAFQKTTELASLDFKFNNSDKQIDFDPGKWDLLHFIIDEVITIPLMKKRKAQILFFLKKTKSDMVTWNTVLRFVRKVRSKNTNGKE